MTFLPILFRKMTGGSIMKNEQIKEQTQERIKQAFIDLCEKNMQENISVSDICKYADVSRSTFYRFFPIRITC